MKIDLVVETPISNSVRAKQVSSMFDVPAQSKARLEWHGDLPIEQRPWNVGLIVGPSGSGKSTILNNLFGRPAEFEWRAASVIDEFDRRHSVEAVAQICQAVGFNTIPAWLRPYGVLSNGEKFRVDLARRLLQADPVLACDEFTSVVDRQVARIGSHAVQKYIRRHDRRFVAATCHYDLEDWLQPDWVFEPAAMHFRWRSVQRRPAIACTISRVPYSAWATFSRFHYLTAALHKGARCWCLFVDGRPAAFAAGMKRPHPKVDDIWGLSRGVVLPDFQGLGLIFVLIDALGAAFKAKRLRLHSYPAHPVYIRSHEHSPNWLLVRPPGQRSVTRGPEASVMMGGRPCAVYQYNGPASSLEDAEVLVGWK